MNAHLKALLDERNHLHDMQRKIAAGAPIGLSIENHAVSQEALERARWGIYSGLGARLRELSVLIYELKKEQDA